jgi:hypothetical protein
MVHFCVRQILWLGCSDSRVPESVVTASRPGDIFVHRNIANQVHPDDDSVLSEIAFAIAAAGVEYSAPHFSTQILAELILCSHAHSNVFSSCRRPHELRQRCGMPQSHDHRRPSARIDDASMTTRRPQEARLLAHLEVSNLSMLWAFHGLSGQASGPTPRALSPTLVILNIRPHHLLSRCGSCGITPHHPRVAVVSRLHHHCTALTSPSAPRCPCVALTPCVTLASPPSPSRRPHPHRAGVASPSCHPRRLASPLYNVSSNFLGTFYNISWICATLMRCNRQKVI